MKKRPYSQFYLCKKIFGKYKNIWQTEKAHKFRSINKIKKSLFQEKLKRKRMSNFGKLLRNKQELKFFYCNIKEKIFKTKFKMAKQSYLKTIDRFASLLEKRLDIILFRSCFIFSLYQAKQVITHGHISVNNKTIFNVHKKLRQFDLIKFKTDKYEMSSRIFYRFKNKIKGKKDNPKHLELSFKNLTICFLWSPSLFELHYLNKNIFDTVGRFYK
uniref:Ribosomal protein S4 n=1 Tax=Storeatula sp. CCMP1868 TaxID=195070 RepID=A0A2P1G884_9CRYP|nr:ribosomal protein S4 [Storeatula sp. CCMP1868]AVM81171.1 ribosomal protein S4 [Storeatula sp. CCMP1868]